MLRSPIARMALVLSGAVCLLVIENVWIDPRIVARSHHRLPSLVPEGLGGTWLLVLMILAIAVLLAAVCQVLLMRDTRLPAWNKAVSGALVLAAIVLSGKWIVATGGDEVRAWAQLATSKHSVILRWNPSSTPGARYNIYRGGVQGTHPEKLNASPVDKLSFTDTTVMSGVTYYYVARAVDSSGNESSDSNETVAKIP